MTASAHSDRATGLVVTQFGDWQRARISTMPLARPGPREILVECQAAALNFQDLLMIEGRYQLKPPLPFIAGRDLAGRAIAVGPEVAHVATGQHVAALVPWGAFADRAIAPADACFALPPELDFAKAAASTSIFATAVFALSLRAQLRAGERILIGGAAGGVGLATIQIARQIGAEVIALVSSTAKQQAAMRAGAHHVVRLDQLRTPRDELRDAVAAVAPAGLDVVIDMVGGDVFDGAIRCLKPGGRLVVVGFASGRIAEAKTNYILIKGLSVIGSALTLGLHQYDPEMREAMRQVYQDVAAGRLDPFIGATYPLEEFGQAAAAIAERRAVGKIVLLPPPK
jgi:NADPH:quinone reductase